MSEKLENRKCNPCAGGENPLKGESLYRICQQLQDGWTVKDEPQPERSCDIDNFRQALDFTNRVGELAENQALEQLAKFATWTESMR
jgi:4a-hydroxytetrahydrobiopterin dehydratase